MVYDEVISSVLKIVHRLNLSASTSLIKEEEVYIHADCRDVHSSGHSLSLCIAL